MTQSLPLPEPGDIFVVPDEAGHWSGRLTFARFHNSQADVGEFTDDAGECVILPFDAVTRPGLVDPEPSAPPKKRRVPTVRSRRRKRRPTDDLPLTDAQRRAIFGIARRRCIDPDDVRSLCPNRSVRSLTRAQAANLIDRLNGMSWEKRGRGGDAADRATPQQRRYAKDLAARQGMDDAEFAAFLRRNYQADSIADRALNRYDLNRIINALHAIEEKRKRQIARRAGT
jgi:hypothetical protein